MNRRAAMTKYVNKDTISWWADDREPAGGSLLEERHSNTKEGIVSEYTFMAVIIDAFFARFFFLIFVVGVILLFGVSPLLIAPQTENMEWHSESKEIKVDTFTFMKRWHATPAVTPAILEDDNW